MVILNEMLIHSETYLGIAGFRQNHTIRIYNLPTFPLFADSQKNIHFIFMKYNFYC